MPTREEIIRLGDQLIRDKGYNAFSFYDISKKLKIKNASIHYHFPTKTDLGVSIVKNHNEKLERLKESMDEKSPLLKLKAFLSVYDQIKSEGRVCIVGSLATDLNTVDTKMEKELKDLASKILEWVTGILKEGKAKKIFAFEGSPRTKALMIISNMLAALQLSRLTGDKDFYTIQETILKDLKA
jgi:TetR/AcrR family transcriptional repressor of nem operon